MSFADEIVPATVFEHILRKQRLGIVSHNAGLEAVVCSLDITVAVIDSHDQFFFEFFHNGFPSFSPSFRGVDLVLIVLLQDFFIKFLVGG